MSLRYATEPTLSLSNVLQDDDNRLFKEEIVDSVSPLPGPASLQPRGSFRLLLETAKRKELSLCNKSKIVVVDSAVQCREE